MLEEQLVEGQLVEVRYKEDDCVLWYKGIVLNVYDRVVHIKTKVNRISYSVDPSERTKWGNGSLTVIPLTKSGKPVIAKKNIFGKYILSKEK